ncbi:hypothetical protein ACFL2H_08990 [Planctomycetota bacterium]
MKNVFGIDFGDGVFDSSDLVLMFQAGHYEQQTLAGLSEGDWNLDGVFDSSDLIKILQNNPQ